MKADLAIDDFEVSQTTKTARYVRIGCLCRTCIGLSSRLSSLQPNSDQEDHNRWCTCLLFESLCVLDEQELLCASPLSLYGRILPSTIITFKEIFLVIWFPVWIDFFGGQYKTLWLTFMQLGVALGAVAGYLVTSLFVSYTGSVLHFHLIFTVGRTLPATNIVTRSLRNILLDHSRV